MTITNINEIETAVNQYTGLKVKGFTNLKGFNDIATRESGLTITNEDHSIDDFHDFVSYGSFIMVLEDIITGVISQVAIKVELNYTVKSVLYKVDSVDCLWTEEEYGVEHILASEDDENYNEILSAYEVLRAYEDKFDEFFESLMNQDSKEYGNSIIMSTKPTE